MKRPMTESERQEIACGCLFLLIYTPCLIILIAVTVKFIRWAFNL